MTSKTHSAKTPNKKRQSDFEDPVQDLLEALAVFDVMFQRSVAQLGMDDLKRRVQAGDPMALLVAIGNCLVTDNNTPDWVSAGFRGAFLSYHFGVVKTLDEAFHVSRPKNWRRKRAIKNALDLELWRRVSVYKFVNPGSDSDDRSVFSIVEDEVNEYFASRTFIPEDFNLKFNWQDVRDAYKRVQKSISENA